MKVVKKYLCDVNNYGWKHVMRFYLNSVLNIGDFVLLMQVKQSMTERLPLFYREVLSAHASFLKHLSYECTDLSVLKNVPIFLNKYIVNKGVLLYNINMLRAGFVQLKDLMYEVLPGFYPPQVIYDGVQDIDEDVTMTAIVAYYQVILKNLPEHWSVLIKNSIVPSCSDSLPVLRFFTGDRWKNLEFITSKFIYSKFVLSVVQKPTSLAYWRKVFPSLDVDLIWSSWKIKGNSIEAEDSDFKIRHNKVFTNVILHQLDRTVERHCDTWFTSRNFIAYVLRLCRTEDFFCTLENLFTRQIGIGMESV